jgi:hypothetical protein
MVRTPYVQYSTGFFWVCLLEVNFGSTFCMLKESFAIYVYVWAINEQITNHGIHLAFQRDGEKSNGGLIPKG